MSNSFRKILVLGHRLDEGGVISYRWSELPDDLNLADHDLVIFDFSVLGSETSDPVDKIFRMNLWNLVFNKEAEVVIIASPSRISTSKEEGFSSYFTPLSLLPLTVKWSSISGNKVKLENPAFEFYFKRLKKWSFHFDYSSEEDKYKIEEISEALRKKIETVKVACKPIARNGYGRLLGGIFKFSAFDSTPGEGCRKKFSKDNPPTDYRDFGKTDSAPIMWLPPAGEDSRKMVGMLLRNIFTVEEVSAKPSWLDDYTLPEILSIDKKVAEIKKNLSVLREERDALLEERAEYETVEDILYQRGGRRLTGGVETALNYLGCRVTGNVINNENEEAEGLRFVDPNKNKWIALVCGGEESITKEDIRRLDNWVKINILENDWSGYPVIISNCFCSIDPRKRRKEDLLSPKMDKILNRFGFLLLPTLEIFEAVVSFEKREYNPEKFWKALCGRGRLFE